MTERNGTDCYLIFLFSSLKKLFINDNSYVALCLVCVESFSFGMCEMMVVFPVTTIRRSKGVSTTVQIPTTESQNPKMKAIMYSHMLLEFSFTASPLSS